MVGSLSIGKVNIGPQLGGVFIECHDDQIISNFIRYKPISNKQAFWHFMMSHGAVSLLFQEPSPSEEKDILVCIITAIQLSCNYTVTWLDRTSQG